MMNLMNGSPHDFILNATAKDLERCAGFVHRTFNGTDLRFFFESLQNIYRNKGGLEKAFGIRGAVAGNECQQSIINFRNIFFEIPYPSRSAKHISNPEANSSAKRLCMYLRWMVRRDKAGVDFGIWKEGKNKLLPAHLMCPLDVHTGNTGRKLGLLQRTQNDWKAVEELTASLRSFDAADPVKYDFALFGLGVFEKF
jgi:uncharacterized protein (TIGR02757 family)